MNNLMTSFIETIMSLPRIGVSGLLEIVIISITVYKVSKLMKDTKAWTLLKGLLIILLIYTTAWLLEFNVIVKIFQSLILFIGIAIIIMIQPELKKLLEKIGSSGIDIQINKIFRIFKEWNKTDNIVKNISDESIQEIVKGCCAMSKVKTGALIVIENNTPLNEFSETGIKVDARITSQLLINIFEKNTPLHDGAVIVKHDRIESATCYLPLSNNKRIDKALGTRHRAAIGMTEETDSVVIVVSEETGGISVSSNGRIKTDLSREQLTEELRKMQDKYTQKITNTKKKRVKPDIKLAVISFVGTLIVWIVMMQSLNPYVTTTLHNVPVQLLNTETIEEYGKTYELETSAVIDVSLRGRKSDIDHINISDLEVIADFNELSFVNSVPIQCKIPGYSDIDFKLSKQTIEVRIENLVSAEYEIYTEEAGIVESNYYIADMKSTLDSIVISGSESIIDTIDHVVAKVDVTDISKDTTINVEPEVFDKNGSIIQNDKLTFSYSKIPVKIRVFNTKKVDLRVNYIMDREVMSKIIGSITCDKKEIVIAGTDENLEKYDRIEITIPIDINPLDVSNDSYSKNITISDLMPEDVYVANGYEKLKIVAKFIDFYPYIKDVNGTDIEVKNLPENKQVDFGSLEKQFIFIDTIKSDAFDINSISLSVDLTNCKIGKNTLKITFDNVPDGMLIYGDPNIEVTVSSKETN